jgi:hypothetical protein
MPWGRTDGMGLRREWGDEVKDEEAVLWRNS